MITGCFSKRNEILATKSSGWRGISGLSHQQPRSGWPFQLNEGSYRRTSVPAFLHVKVEGGEEEFVSHLRAYVLCAPHLELGGEGNNAFVVESRDENCWWQKGKSLAGDRRFAVYRLSCGYVGRSDGYTDIPKRQNGPSSSMKQERQS